MKADADKSERPVLTNEKVAIFEKTEAQLEGFFEEIGNISKKKHDDAVNKFKLGFINQTLAKANDLLGEEYRPFPDFTAFDLDGSITTASDVVTMLSQYLKVMDEYRSDHTHQSLGGGPYYWNLPTGNPAIKAKRPKKFT